MPYLVQEGLSKLESRIWILSWESEGSISVVTGLAPEE